MPTTDGPTRLLWLLRHAKTLADPPRGGTDHDRVLAPRGRRDADALGRRLGPGGDRLGFDARDLPQLVLCSTAARTRATAQRALALVTDPPPVTYLRSLYHAGPREVLDELALVDDAVGAAMVVGHNPTTMALARTMSASCPSSAGRSGGTQGAEGTGYGGENPAAHGFPTTALAVFALPVRHWRDVAEGMGRLRGSFRPPY